MSHLQKIQRGKQEKPHLVLIYGTDGIGKSTFGADAPNPIFIGNEDGTNFIDVARMPSCKDWFSFREQLVEILTGEHDFKTLVIDSLDWLETLMHKSICETYKVKSINNAAGGFGNGLKEALTEWAKIKDTLNSIREKRKMNIILIAHAENIPFNDPTTQATYDRYQLKIDKKAAAFFKEYVDFLLFANFEITTAKEGNKTRAFGDGMRLLYTERRPGFDAKSRKSLPFSMPLSWADFEKSLTPLKAETVISIISKELEGFADDYVAKVMKYVDENQDSVTKMQEVLNRVRVKKSETV